MGNEVSESRVIGLNKETFSLLTGGWWIGKDEAFGFGDPVFDAFGVFW